MGASEGECVSVKVKYEQLMEMERRQAARLEQAVQALTTPKNFMLGTTWGAMLLNFWSGLLLHWFIKVAGHMLTLAKARFRIQKLMPRQKNGESCSSTTDVDVSEAASAFVAVTICDGSTTASNNTLDTIRQEKELHMRKKMRRSLILKGYSVAGKKLKSKGDAATRPCDQRADIDEASTSAECPDSSKEGAAFVSLGMLMPSTTLTTADEQAQDLLRQARDILPPHTQLHHLQPGSIFLSATTSASLTNTSAIDDLLHCAKRLLQKGLQLDPQCTVQLGAAALLYCTTPGEKNIKVVLLEEGVQDVPIITNAQKFGKRTILIKGFYLQNTEIKATTRFDKSVCLKLVYHEKLANGVDLLLAQLPQGELLGSKSFVYVNKTIFVDDWKHPLVVRSEAKEIDVYKHKSTMFGTLCKRQFWICLVLLYIYQVLVFQTWRRLYQDWIFQLITSFFSCLLVEHIITPWKFDIFPQWLDYIIRLTNLDNILVFEESYVTSIMEMEESNSAMPNLRKPNRVTSKICDRESESSSDEEESESTEEEGSVNDENWEWRCYKRFLRKWRWVQKRVAGAKDLDVGVRRPFDVVTTVDRDGRESVELIVHSPHLVRILSDCLPNTGATFNQGSKIQPKELFFRRAALKAYLDTNYDAMLSGHDAQLSASVWHARHLLRFVERHFAETLVQYDRLQAENRVSFDMLWAFFLPGTEVCRRCPVTNQECFATVKRPAVIEEARDGLQCHVTLNVMDFNVTSFHKCTQAYRIRAFEGEVPFTSLQVCPLRFFPNQKQKDLEDLFVRVGNRFYEFAMQQPFRFMQFKGSLNFYVQEGGCVSLRKLNADGRVMIDLLSFARINPDYPLGNAQPPCEVMVGMWTPEPGGMKKPSEDELKMAPAFAYGFSFRLKKWGCFELCGLHDITFNKDAFHALQLSKQSQKQILWNVVQQYVVKGGGPARLQNELDPIAQKGTGCIVLCHGPPGTGKTLTAEALAETMECPLWSISTCELGNEPDSVESKMSQIMEIAHTWHAILLLDEADAYLQKRDDGMDVKRNQLTSVFLRMLEYYRGIMFLTTNRVAAFDDAILSRTTLAIWYPELDDTQRRSIWESLLTRAGIFNATYDAFLHYNFNGRQIRNVIHLAQLLAQGQTQLFNITHVLQALDAVTVGKNELLPTPPPS